MPTSLRLLIAVLPLVLWSHAAGASETRNEFAAEQLDGKTLLFQRERTAGVGVEGFVIDTKALVDTLKLRVLEARALGALADITPLQDAEPGGRTVTATATPGAYAFAHRFAEPFTSVAVRMALSPLDDPSESALVDELVFVLALCVVVGLYALYRMTATQLIFAERSRNFVSAVSHELKTPLTAIRMYGEMLAEDLVADDSKRQDYYRTITQESERLSRLIDNVLNLSRLDQKRELLLRTGDVVPYLRDALEVLRHHVERQSFHLEIEFDAPVPIVQFEPDAIKQVLFNLVDNSVKYCRDAADKRITVHLKAFGSGARLVVRDYGSGVDADHLRKIFLPFFRGENELTRKFAGTGIGLALVKSLVIAMHGQVTAENLPDGFRVLVDFAPGLQSQ